MKIFISGGANNGKSMFAQTCAKRLAKEGHLWYISAHITETDEHGTYLVDSVTALLTNEMFDGMSGVDACAAKKTADELISFSKKAENVVFVSDNIYCDAAFYDEWTEAFRKGLAEVDSRLAAECDIVAEFCCGQIIYYKGAGIL